MYETVRPLQYEYEVFQSFKFEFKIEYCNLLREMDVGDLEQLT